MTNNVETAAGDRFVVGPDGRRLRTSTFPAHWGRPPDDVEERTGWIRRHIAEGNERLDRGDVVEGQRPKTGRQALARLQRKVGGTADANRTRLQLLELNRRGPE